MRPFGLHRLKWRELFLTERSVITKHLRNISKIKELEQKSNVQKMHIALSDKPVRFIISTSLFPSVTV